MVEVRFEQPPLQQVVLTVWIEPLPSLRTLDLAALREDWADEFPNLEETPPYAPWREPADQPVGYVQPEGKWPVPACLFASDDRDRQVLIQNDRFSLSWHFEGSGPSYPGFEALVGELEARFLQFSGAIQRHDNPAPTVLKVSIDYTNLLEGVAGDSFAAYLLTGSSEVRDSRLGSDLVVLQRHYCATDENNLVSLSITLDSSDHDDADEKAAESPQTMLRIAGMAYVLNGDQPWQRLRDAHGQVLDIFLESVDEKMQEGWGRLDA